ncbi:TDT family transporter [Streptomyces liangshanensis]|uniref:TDT family transporter n=1 Tax=Streptomyces liangshanensis TaxID=2717324 RepID=A0A6G9H5V8_9ACTN|nr:TDT family transporter [Streptomyces liangshanensis]
MVSLAPHPVTRPPAVAPLPRPSAPRHLGPAWYATVMGTAVVASAGAALPQRVPGLRAASAAVWALSAVLLVAVLAARATRWARHRDRARADLLDPAVAPFFGCLPMALLAVGGATLAVGGDVLGPGAALRVDAVLFGVGTVLGLVVAVAIPYLMVVRHRLTLADVSPVWLLPVVPPMVAAGAGAGLVPHLPAGQGREALLLGCYAMFGLSLLATLALLPLIAGRLLLLGPLPLALTPAMFLVLGPLGQSTTAVGRLADVAPTAVSGSLPAALGAFAVVYGVAVMGFALLWLALSAALVMRALRRGMPFSMGWWAFTFPVGTCVTGAEVLALRTGLVAFQWLAAGLFVVLVSAWVTVGAGTVRGLLGGALPAAPRAPRPGTGRTR